MESSEKNVPVEGNRGATCLFAWLIPSFQVSGQDKKPVSLNSLCSQYFL